LGFAALAIAGEETTAPSAPVTPTAAATSEAAEPSARMDDKTLKNMSDTEASRDARDAEAAKAAAEKEADRIDRENPELGRTRSLRYETVSGTEVSVGDVLRMVEEMSPQIRAATMREVQSNDLLFIQRSTYFPFIEAGAGVQWPATGFSSGIPWLGDADNKLYKTAGQPSAGLWTIYKAFDLTRVIRYQIYQAALRSYFNAARYRGYMIAYQRLQDEIDSIIRLVRKLVKGGQHTVISLMLLEDQATESAIKYGIFQDQYHSALKRLALQIGKDDRKIAVPASISLDQSVLGVIRPGEKSPLIAQAEADVRTAEANVGRSVAQNAPTIWFGGTVGAVSGGISGVYDYGATFGLTIPVFEGFRIQADNDRARAQESETRHALDTVKLDVDIQNTRYDQVITATRMSLPPLLAERDAGYEALKIAKSRYLNFLGGLADIREGIRDLIRIETAIVDARADLLNSLADKAILNGGTVTHY
jgi:outer membrane protein TolC